MTITYYPYTEEELAEKRKDSKKILERGIYDFSVVCASETLTKETRNPMIVLDLEVWDKEGKKYSIRDWLPIVDIMLFKIKHFWESVRKPEMYGRPTEATDFEGHTGKLEIDVKERKISKPDGTIENKKYAYVKDFIPAIKVENFEDDIPF